MKIAVLNQKGGVGKTTVSLGLAEASAASGLKTLVVDLDPQANTTSGLGVWNHGGTIADVLDADNPAKLDELVCPSGWADFGRTIEVVPSSGSLAVRETQLALDPVGAQDRLADALSSRDDDLVIIDCPPSLGFLTINALFAADTTLVVTAPSAWSADGVDNVMKTIERVRARRDGKLVLAGVVVNNLGRTRDAKYWLNQISERYPQRVLPPIHSRAAIAEAAAQSSSLRSLGSRAGADEAVGEFDRLLNEVVPSVNLQFEQGKVSA